ncbi:MAG: universal stress protein [Mesorhizobium sp.]|nr:MAG: universal stress protein [Mesorhizobium sp.]RWK98757.1 MAG: universal stress protein [Mesorhizobium sp.]RWL02220.1 MAG: universal stress protein [Mesorhizobium sp.]TIP24517.1 MAG: universal stress protein [Mesorhizobium sp.]TIP79559.1 MAG: universal stress protein [Mesorhizobium sp.]
MKLVLCATDGSERAYKALEFATNLARSKNAKLLVDVDQGVCTRNRILQNGGVSETDCFEADHNHRRG